MYAAEGVGLAATQVNVHERVVVMDVSEEHNQPLVMINPELLWKSDERIKGEEGCLSFPNLVYETPRAFRAVAKGLVKNQKSRSDTIVITDAKTRAWLSLISLLTIGLLEVRPMS